MDELAGLCRSLAIAPAGEVVQNIPEGRPCNLYQFRQGRQVQEAIEEHGADLAVFNNTLSPAQLSNLSGALEVEGSYGQDRTHPQYLHRPRPYARRPVYRPDYAHLKYMLPQQPASGKILAARAEQAARCPTRAPVKRQSSWTAGKSRRRWLPFAVSLPMWNEIRAEQRKKRSAGLPSCAQSGYTNAGKSSLMNRLLSDFGAEEEKSVYTADMLFATLDTSVRRIEPEGRRPFLLSDTVGFINDLPTDLVQAFRSTLEEALYAALVVDVVDVSDPNCRMHMDVTEKTLKELGADGIPVIHVMNKAELVSGSCPRKAGDRLYLSVRNNLGIDLLLDEIEEILSAGTKLCRFRIPYSDSGVESILRKEAVIRAVAYDADAIRVTAEVRPRIAGQLKNYMTE